jgi:hypothetical protein
MPVRQVVLSAAEAATFGLLPIMWRRKMTREHD